MPIIVLEQLTLLSIGFLSTSVVLIFFVIWHETKEKKIKRIIKKVKEEREIGEF